MLSTDTAARPWFRLLGDPSFGPFFLGKTVGASGIWMYATVAGVVTFHVDSSALDVGLVGAAQFLPQIFLSALAGSIADRGNTMRLIRSGWGLCAVVSLSLGALLALTGPPTAVWPLFLASLVVGLGVTTGGPAMQMVIPAVVRPAELPTAIAMDVIPMVAGRAIGPAVGAFLLAAAGPTTAFVVTGLSCLFFVACLGTVKIPGSRQGSASADSSVRSGLRYVRGDRIVQSLLIGTAAIGVGSDPALTLAPTISATLVGDTTLVGALTSSFGVGSVAGVLAIGVLRRWVDLPVISAVGLAMLAAGLILVGATGSEAPILIGFALAGTGMTVSLTSTSTLLQAHIPPAFRGRVMALWLIAFAGSRPLAAALDGAVADLASASTACLLMAGGVIAASWFVRPSRIRE